MVLLETATHPFLVHVLIGLGFLYPLSRVSDRFSASIRIPVHVQARVLLFFFPIVFGAGFLARREFQPIDVRLAGRVDLHFTLGILTYLAWVFLLWKDSRWTTHNPEPKRTRIESFLLLAGFILLIGTAAFGGQMVYGNHPLPASPAMDPR